MKNYTLFGKNIITYYVHNIMYINNEQLPKKDISNMRVVRITEENLKECEGGAFSINIMRQYLRKQAQKSEGYIFYINKEAIGYLWVMYRGGNEIQYKVRNVDAFLFDVCIFSKYRGNAYIEMFLYWIAKHLQREGIEELYLACEVDNECAYRTYKRIGFQVREEKKFCRILKKIFLIMKYR